MHTYIQLLYFVSFLLLFFLLYSSTKRNNILDTLQIICHKTLYSLYHFAFGIRISVWCTSTKCRSKNWPRNIMYIYASPCVMPIIWSEIQCNQLQTKNFIYSTLCVFISILFVLRFLFIFFSLYFLLFSFVLYVAKFFFLPFISREIIVCWYLSSVYLNGRANEMEYFLVCRFSISRLGSY